VSNNDRMSTCIRAINISLWDKSHSVRWYSESLDDLMGVVSASSGESMRYRAFQIMLGAKLRLEDG